MILNLFVLLAYVCSISAEYAPVATLDLPTYMGRWYQVYKNRFDMSFQGDGTCSVADYGLTSTNVTVLNSQCDSDGKLDQINGYAFYLPGDSGGNLRVSLEGVPRSAPYWVIELGEIRNGQYQYSIVSDDKRVSLFVLARNVSSYFTDYDTAVKESLENYGFTNYFNKPIPMIQEGCDYTRYTN